MSVAAIGSGRYHGHTSHPFAFVGNRSGFFPNLPFSSFLSLEGAIKCKVKVTSLSGERMYFQVQ